MLSFLVVLDFLTRALKNHLCGPTYTYTGLYVVSIWFWHNHENYLPRRTRSWPSSLDICYLLSFSFVCGYLDVFHAGMTEAVQRETVTHARVQAVVRRVQQHIRPADRVVVPPGVEA